MPDGWFAGDAPTYGDWHLWDGECATESVSLSPFDNVGAAFSRPSEAMVLERVSRFDTNAVQSVIMRLKAAVERCPTGSISDPAGQLAAFSFSPTSLRSKGDDSISYHLSFRSSEATATPPRTALEQDYVLVRYGTVLLELTNTASSRATVDTDVTRQFLELADAKLAPVASAVH